MGVFENFPYSNFHNLNLDWILNEIKSFAGRLDGYEGDLEDFQHQLDAFPEQFMDEIDERLLPIVTPFDEGEVLAVVGGHWRATTPPDGNLPVVTSAANGKALQVVNGVWTIGADLAHIAEVSEQVESDVLNPIPSGINMYDEANNSELYNVMYRIGTVYLDGYFGDVVFSCKGTGKTGYFTNLVFWDADNNQTPGTFGATVNTVPNGIRQGKLVSVPRGTVKMTFRYRFVSASETPLIEEVMVTVGNTIGTGYVPYTSYPQFVKTTLDVIEKIAYVDPTGDDTNDGLSPETAVATFNRALAISNTVYAKRGSYPPQPIDINGRTGVKILPLEQDGATDPILIDGGAYIAASEFTSVTPGIYSTVIGPGFQFNEVFIDHTLDPVTAGGNYRANVFVNLRTVGKLKLKPVLSQAALYNENNTFTWDGTYLICRIDDAQWDGVTMLAEAHRINIANSRDVELREVCARYAYSNMVKVDDSENVRFVECEASYSATAMGFAITNTDATFDRCVCRGNNVDGFNFHGSGYTVMNDCQAIANFDDGCSHHNDCIGTINGGEFSYNGKGGITPAYGANVDIYGALCRYNDRYGIGFLSTADDPDMRGIINSCALVGNTAAGLRVESKWTVDGINIAYHGNTTDQIIEGSYTEY